MTATTRTVELLHAVRKLGLNCRDLIDEDCRHCPFSAKDEAGVKICVLKASEPSEWADATLDTQP